MFRDAAHAAAQPSTELSGLDTFLSAEGLREQLLWPHLLKLLFAGVKHQAGETKAENWNPNV